MKAITVTALLLGLAAAGCQGTQRPPQSVAFSAQEAAFIKRPGQGVIVGHAFRTRANGVVVNAAGEVIRLIPATAYARERFTQLYGSRKFLPVANYPRNDMVDPAYSDHTRTVKSEANGRFAFEGVPPGTYYVTAQVVWGDDPSSREGGSVYDMVTLTGREAQPANVILSGN
jgi:hypothetical protein